MAGAVVQTVGLDAAGSATTIASGAFAGSVTAGNFLYVVTNSDTADTVAITKNSGTATIGTPTELGSIVEAGVLDELTHFSILITGSGTLDLLATFGSSQDNRGIFAAEISGVSGVDDHAVGTDAGNDPTDTMTSTVSTQPAFGLAVSIFYQGGTPAVGTGWTDGGTDWGVVRILRLQTQAFTSTGDKTADFGNAVLDRNCCSMVIFTDGLFVQPATRIPFRGSFGRGRTRYGF